MTRLSVSYNTAFDFNYIFRDHIFVQKQDGMSTEKLKALIATTKNKVKKDLYQHMLNRGITESDVYAYFGRPNIKRGILDRRDLLATGSPPSEPFPLDFVQRMVMATGVDPEIFDPDNFDMKGEEKWDEAKRQTWKDKEVGTKSVYYFKDRTIFTPWGPQHHIREVVDLTYKFDGNPKTRKGYTDKYKNAILPYIKDTAKSITVVEYLGKDFPHQVEHLEGYQEAHQAIFWDILVKFFDKESFNKYTRILTLPDDLIKKIENPSRYGVKALQFCSQATYEHIYACLNLFDEKKITVCVAPAIRPVNFGIIEYKNKPTILVSEYYKNQDGTLVPAVLFVNECNLTQDNNLMNQLYYTYNQEVTEYIKTVPHKKMKTHYLTAEDDQIKNLTINAWGNTKGNQNSPEMKSMDAKVAYMNGFRKTNVIRKILAKRESV